MKKHLVKFTLLLLAIALGASNAFAEDVYTKTGKDDWATNDVTEWGAINLSVTEKTALVLEGVGSIYAKHNFTFKNQNPLVTLVAEFKAGNNCANANSYDYFTFGGITFKFNRVGSTSGYFKLVADNCEMLIKEQYNLANLEGIGLTDYPFGVIASGALLQYLHETQKNSLSHLMELKVYSTENYMVIVAYGLDLKICF